LVHQESDFGLSRDMPGHGDVGVAGGFENSLRDRRRKPSDVNGGDFAGCQNGHLRASVRGAVGTQESRRSGAVADVHQEGYEEIARAIDLVGIRGNRNVGMRSRGANPPASHHDHGVGHRRSAGAVDEHGSDNRLCMTFLRRLTGTQGERQESERGEPGHQLFIIAERNQIDWSTIGWYVS
jgi:hypothetical protein